MNSTDLKRLFERQSWHLVALLLLLAGIVALWNTPGLLTGQVWGLSTTVWLTIALAVPIIHQIYVWLIWRTQLDSDWVMQRFPRYGFTVYVVIFMLLLAARLIAIGLLTVSNRDTLSLTPSIRYGLTLLLAIPSLYLGYSVIRYFGIVRAAGADHFDPAYQRMPLVKVGIYRYTGNGMYLFGFMALWIPGLVLASKAALLVALFNHVYIWVHYYCTELPDMSRIYGNTSSGEPFS